MIAKLVSSFKRSVANLKIAKMNIDYQMTGTYIDDLGVSHYDPRGINQALARLEPCSALAELKLKIGA